MKNQTWFPGQSLHLGFRVGGRGWSMQALESSANLYIQPEEGDNETIMAFLYSSIPPQCSVFLSF